jgi:uncharacterized protein YndB with AHSA1/START domain
MTSMTEQKTDATVRKSVVVKASQARAFKVFTEGFDTWWPRTHHIGGPNAAPVKKFVIEPKQGGRCYSEHADGSQCPWGSLLVWDPPSRFVMSWQITENWQFETDLAKSSEVEVSFTTLGDGTVRVDLEHRHFDRHGAGGDTIRKAVSAGGGWPELMELYAKRVEQEG